MNHAVLNAHSHVLGLWSLLQWLTDDLKKAFWGPEIQQLITGSFDPSVSDSVYAAVYKAMSPAGAALTASAATIRVMRMVADHRASGIQIITDTMVRGAIVGGLYMPVAGGNSLGYVFITTMYSASMQIGVSMFTSLMGVIPGQVSVGSAGLGGIATALIGIITGLFLNPFAAYIVPVILILVVILLLLYVVILMISRFLLVAMVIAMAPLVIGVSIFEPKNRFTEWWVEAFIGSLLIPIVLGFSLGLTILFAVNGLVGGSAGWAVIIEPIIMIGGIWMTGKMMHKLTWRHFQHGGPIGAISAGIGAMWVAPQLAFEAHQLASAFGVRKGEGLLSLGGKFDSQGNFVNGQGPNALGRGLDKLMQAVVGKQAAFAALDKISHRVQQTNAMDDVSAEAGGDSPEAFQQAMQSVAIRGLSADNLQSVDAMPGGRSGWANYVAERKKAMNAIELASYNPNNLIGGFAGSPHSGYSSSGSGGGGSASSSPSGSYTPGPGPGAPTMAPDPTEPTTAPVPPGFAPNPSGGPIVVPRQR